MKLPRRSLAALLVSVSLPLAACGKKDPAPATQAPPPVTAATSATPAASADAAVASTDAAVADRAAPDAAAAEQAIPKVNGVLGTPALAHIPSDPLFVWTGVPSKLWQGLGLDALVAKHLGTMPEESQGVFARVKGVLDGTLGIDPNGVAGIAWPDPNSEGYVAFLPVSDRAKLEAAIADLATQASFKVVKEARGDGTLFSMEGSDKGALFLTDKVAYIAFGDGIDAKALASVLATTTADKSVLANERYAKAAARVGEADVALYLDFKRLFGMFLARPGDSKRSAALMQLMESISGSAGTLTIAATIKDDAIEATGHMDVGEGSPIAKLIQPAGKVIPAVALVDSVPAFLFAGKLDWKTYLDLAKLVLASEGDDFDEGANELREATGIDLEKDVLGKLSGEIGIVATGDVAEALRSGKGPSALGGAAYIGFTDAELPKRLLGLAATALHQDKGGAAPETLRVPLDGRALFIRVVGLYVVATTDEATFARFAKLDGAGAMPGLLGNDRLKALVERTDLGALMLIDQTLAAGMVFMGGSRSEWSEPRPADLPKAKAAKWAEMERLNKELQTLLDKRDGDENAKILALVGKLGMTAEAAWVEGSTVVWHIGQYPRGASVKEVIAGLVDGVANREAGTQNGADDPKDDPKIGELRTKINALRDELWGAKQEVVPEVVPEPAPDKVVPSPK